MEEEKVKLIIFDFDGTIADTLSAVVEIALKLNDKLKLFKDEEIDVEKFRNISSADFINRLSMPKYKLIYYLWEGKKMFGGKIGSVCAFPGVKEVLKKFHEAGIKLAVVTINSESNVRRFLEKQDINYFDYVASPFLFFNKAGQIKKVMRKFNIAPEDTVYVGDETRDIESARQAGVKSVAVTWGFHFRDLLARYKPNYMADTPEELLGLI